MSPSDPVLFKSPGRPKATQERAEARELRLHGLWPMRNGLHWPSVAQPVRIAAGRGEEPRRRGKRKRRRYGPLLRGDWYSGPNPVPTAQLALLPLLLGAWPMRTGFTGLRQRSPYVLEPMRIGALDGEERGNDERAEPRPGRNSPDTYGLRGWPRRFV